MAENPIEGIETFTVSYKDKIKDLVIISFNEVPPEKQKYAFEEFPEDMDAYSEICGLIQMCLMNPAHFQQFNNLTEQEVYEFFWKWVIHSTLNSGSDEVEGMF